MTSVNGTPHADPCCDFAPRAGQAFSVSRSGDAIGGTAGGEFDVDPFAARWLAGADTPDDLGSLEPGKKTRILGMSDGGFVGVGYAFLDALQQPVVSQFGGVVQTLIPGAPKGSYGVAWDVSADGAVIAGNVGVGGGLGGVRWTLDGGVYTYEFLDSDTYTTCRGISANGTIIVGQRLADGLYQPYRYTDDTGFELLTLPDGSTTGTAIDLSDDGEVIVGDIDIWPGPAIWDEQHGWRELEQVLDDAGALIAGWTLVEAHAISSDGSTIVGMGVDPSGFPQAYRAVLPRKPKIHLLAMGIDDKGLIKQMRGDLSAILVANAFESLTNIEVDPQVLALEFDAANQDDGLENLLAINAAIDGFIAQEAIQAGDTAIIYIGTHGSFLTPDGWHEIYVCHQTNPFFPIQCTLFDTNEYLAMGFDGVQIEDDLLRAKFDTPAWDEINKLFIIDSCFAGGYWGVPWLGDTGDLATLPKSAIIAASTEEKFSYSSLLTGITYTAYAIDYALQGLQDEEEITFQMLTQAIDDAEDWLVDTFSNKNGEFTGMLVGGYDFSEFYGLEFEAEFDPMSARTNDFSLMPGVEPCVADCDADGQLNILDFVCFQNLFATGSPNADCNSDGQLNILDFVCYQSIFGAGCG